MGKKTIMFKPTASLYFKAAGKDFYSGAENLWHGVVTGIEWLFTRHPNKTWGVIAFVLLLMSALSIGEARAERDRARAENVRMLDSLQMVTRQIPTWQTMGGKKAIPVVADNRENRLR